MKIFECSKCGSTDVFVEANGSNTGLYCSDCGKWITWLNKDQLRLAKRQIDKQNTAIVIRAFDILNSTLSDLNKDTVPKFIIDSVIQQIE